jgi:putative hydroxymethylpyrimidine transport system ATP-binding protein
VSAVVEVRNLSKWFDGLHVLRDVTFAVEAGVCLGLLGPSGCGKTTLLRILLGLESFEQGEILGRLDRAGYLPQGGLLFPWKTVVENVELPLCIRGVDREKRRHEVVSRLAVFGLEGFGRAYPHELSGGMQQRVGLLRTIVAGASVLVLDEPFGALDTLTRHGLQDWLAELLIGLDRTMLFVTHDIEEAVVLSDRVILLTERPATVLAVQAIDLALEQRGDRLDGSFVCAKDKLLAKMRMGGRGAGGESVRNPL